MRPLVPPATLGFPRLRQPQTQAVDLREAWERSAARPTCRHAAAPTFVDGRDMINLPSPPIGPPPSAGGGATQA